MLITARPLTAWHGRSTYNNAYHSNVAQNIVMFERTASIEVNVESCQWTSKPGKCQIWLVASECRHPQEPRQRAAVRPFVSRAILKDRGTRWQVFLECRCPPCRGPAPTSKHCPALGKVLVHLHSEGSR